MPTGDELRQMGGSETAKADIDSLVDIRDVRIDARLPKEERIADFIRQIKNPYLFRCGDLVIHSCFSETEVSLTDRLKQYLSNL